ncbi:MAG: hypothetical protein U9R06_03320 [Patescibacteria group bacterium]|nr:hypothetical protein [Patescibacteria group bacterium]
MLFYIVFGNRMAIFAEILNLLMVFSIFAMIFLIVLKIKRRQIKKYIKEDNSSEIIAYVSAIDLLMDRCLILSSFFITVGIAFLNRTITVIDFLQGAFPALILFFWHIYLFKNGTGINEVASLTKIDKTKDEIFIFFLPIVIFIIALGSGIIDSMDSYQAIALFLIIFFGHKRIFKVNIR